MKKRIFALLLAAVLPLGAAIADEPLTDGTVLVDWVDGQETYTAICSGELTLRYDADTNTYATADGLIWKTEGALPFATYQPLLMPRTREELLQCNAIYAALQDASGFWSEKVTGTGVLPVYAAPDENSYRASNGKASVSLAGGATLLMQYGDWSLVRYEVNSSRMRIGWVHTNQLGSAPVMLTDIPVTLKEGAFLTDDPATSWYHTAEVDTLTDVHLLAQYDPFWVYARATMRDGTMLWGFVPLMAVQLNDAVDAAAMASVCGTWGFCGGGELMGWVFTLMADGQGVCYAISDEASESMRYLNEGITADMNPESAGMFQWQIVGGTNGYAHDFILSNTSNGTYVRYHAALTEDGHLGFYQCEAGGHYQRIP